jgi:Polymer-forming cytoskeletal
VITGRVDVGSQETVEDVFILNGDVRIAGRVDGSVFAVNGDVTVSGSVRHGVHALNGRVVLSENARVGGDVTSRDKARVAPGARVDGDVESPGRRFAAGRIGAFAALGVWLAITASTWVRPAREVLRELRRHLEGSQFSEHSRSSSAHSWAER